VFDWLPNFALKPSSFVAAIFTVGMLANVACDARSEPTKAGANNNGSAQDSQPNIIIFIADDLGMGDLSYLGGQPQTPNIDSLAADGIRLSNFHAFPVCSPSRAALLTGRSPLRNGLAWSPLPPWSEDGLTAKEPTLATRLAAVNYRTALIGKWHLGHSTAAQHPNQNGFQHFYGCLNGAIDYWTHQSRSGGLDWQRNGSSVASAEYATDLIATEAVGLIGGHDFEQPLFLVVSFTAPHSPLQAPKPSLQQYTEIPDPARRTYCAMVTQMDTAVGQVLKAVNLQQQAQNTVVLFLSDNGGARDQGAVNQPFRAGKGSVFEGGLKVPAVIHWPEKFSRGAEISAFTTILDIFPTLLAVAGSSDHTSDGPSDRTSDGRNLLPTLLGEPKALLQNKPTPFVAVNSTRAQFALFDDGYKLVRRVNQSDGAVKEWLYHLNVDPDEKKNLLVAQPERALAMRQLLESWLMLDPTGPTLDHAPPPKESQPVNWSPPKDWALR